MSRSGTGIYIPSRGRAQKQFTLVRLHGNTSMPIYVVCPKKERDEYREAVGHLCSVIACPESGIGNTRQWILENTPHRRVMMFDDDMYFYHRIKKGDWHLATNEAADNAKMLKTLRGYLKKDGFVHAGMSTRTDASFYLCGHRECTRVNNVHAFDVEKLLKVMRKTGVTFRSLPVMEDFAVTLSLLQLGIPNKNLLDYVWNQPGSNSSGGCSEYRTEKVQRRAAKMLHEMFPDVVKVVTKKVRGVTSWEGMKERTDVQVQWRKAYLASGKGDRKHWKVEYAARRKT